MRSTSFNRTSRAVAWRRRIILTALAFSCGLLAAPLRADFVYVVNNGKKDISGYSINPATGALTPLINSPFSSGKYPLEIAINPASRFAYFVNFLGKTVSGYSIEDNTGALTEVPGSPFPTGNGPQSVAVDPTGEFVYVANFNGGDVSAYTVDCIDRAVFLKPVSGSPFRAGGGPDSIAIAP